MVNNAVFMTGMLRYFFPVKSGNMADTRQTPLWAVGSVGHFGVLHGTSIISSFLFLQQNRKPDSFSAAVDVAQRYVHATGFRGIFRHGFTNRAMFSKKWRGTRIKN